MLKWRVMEYAVDMVEELRMAHHTAMVGSIVQNVV